MQSDYKNLLKKIWNFAKDVPLNDGKLDNNPIGLSNFFETIDSVLNQKIKKGESIKDYLSTFDAFPFTIEFVNGFIESNHIDTSTMKTLSELNSNHIDKFTDYFTTTIEKLSSTPLSITIPLPASTLQDNETHITEDITYLTVHIKDHIAHRSLQQEAVKAVIKNKDLCPAIKLDFHGYLSTHIENPKIQEQLKKYKTLIMATDIITNNTLFFLNYKPPVTYSMVVADTNKSKTIHLPSSISDSIYLLTFPESIYSDNKNKHAISEILTNTSDNYRVIRSSLPWLYDSYFSESLELSTINISISLESLFSDNNRDNVTEKLKAKFSYSLGKNYSERCKYDELMQQFYNNRSSIVHGRNIKDHRSLVMTNQKVRFLIQKEILSQVKSLGQQD